MMLQHDQQKTMNSLWLPHMATIQEIRQETADVASYRLQFDDPEVATTFRFLPGQFNMLYVPGFGECAISISSDPHQPTSLWHTVRVAGTVTTALQRLSPGDQIGLRGPFGSSWPVEQNEGGDLVLAAGGIGMAPLRPVIYEVIKHRDCYGRVVLLYGARRPGELLYTDQFAQWREAGIEIEVTVDLGNDQWTGAIGFVPALFHQLQMDLSRAQVMTCGPEVMMRFIVFEALARKMNPHNVYLSLERNMSCAVGLCGHCQLGPKFVCKDGPVFNYPQMEPFLLLEDL